MGELTARHITVAAVGVTAHLATVLVRPDGAPAAEAILWKDNRAWREALDLSSELGSTLEKVTGRPPSAESTAARIRWLSQADPNLLSRTRWLLTLKDFLVMRLTGRARSGRT